MTTPDAIDERLRKAAQQARIVSDAHQDDLEERVAAKVIGECLNYRAIVEAARELLRCTDELRPAIDALERLRRALGDTDARGAAKSDREMR